MSVVVSRRVRWEFFETSLVLSLMDVEGIGVFFYSNF